MADTVLLSQLNKLRKVALRGGFDDALDWLGPHLRDLQKTERERPWPLGRCEWCWALHNRLREATETNTAGGPYCCTPCWLETYEGENA